MGLPVEINNLMLGSLGGYTVGRSLRFRSSASAYLNRTPSASSRVKFTFSAWVKRGALGINAAIFDAYSDAQNYCILQFFSDNTLSWYNQNGAGTVTLHLNTTQVFRDPSAWYHIVVNYDSAQATSTNRAAMYINGVQVTAFGTATYPSQNTTAWVNAAVAHDIGRYGGASNYFDGYLAEVNFIDGSALTPTSFGAYDTNGVWQPKKYSGTYGTNGFYLPFSNTSSTATLGNDFSGNSNTWTVNNISLTAGTTYDSMIDSPTNAAGTSTGIGNYPVWSPIDKDGGFSTSNGNLTLTASSAARAKTTMTIPTGLWYVEINLTSLNNGGTVGIIPQSNALGLSGGSNDIGIGSTEYGIYIQSANGDKLNNNSRTSYGGAWATGNVIMIALDFSGADGSKKIYFGNNGNWANGSGSWNQSWATAVAAFSNISGSNYIIASGQGGVTSITFDINFGQRPFNYTPPSGYKALNTYNLPAPSIANGAQYMAATTYTGTGASNTISNAVNGVSFAPDFIWLKSRSGIADHALMNTVVGATLGLSSNNTSAEFNQSANFSSFNSNGFTVQGTSTSYNANGSTFVGWQWKGGGTGVTNNSGTITSTVSANPSAGFSIVKYFGNITSGATVGHGLGVAPDMIIGKNRDTATEWWVYHSALGNTKYIVLNSTAAAVTSSVAWNNTSPTSSVFTLGGAGNPINANQDIAYCFSAVRGYSAFGSITGNGSTDGPFVYTGFRPRWVLFKNSSASEEWLIWDTSRDTINVMGNYLQAHSSAAEISSPPRLDMLSNGFKIRTSFGPNSSGATYIYAAFAENPFNYSRAR